MNKQRAKSKGQRATKKFMSKSTCMSFPLVGNLSSEGFWTSQNDRKNTSECIFTYELLSKSKDIHPHPNPPPSTDSLPGHASLSGAGCEAGRARGRELIRFADKYSSSSGGLWLGANGSKRRGLGGGGAELLRKFLLYTLYCLLVIFILDESVFAQSGDLKEKIPDLCYKCHVKLKESLSRSYVHFPFKDGKCIACHDAHTSDARGLVKKGINPLCLSCHEGIKKALKKNFVHHVLKKGVCTDCHYAHSGENKHLLVKAQRDLCWGCHEPLKDQLKKSYTHKPFREGECASCHDPHASSEENQIRDIPNKLCKSCHTAKCKIGNVSITSAIEKLSCDECHSGHSSNTSGLLGPYGHTAFLDKKCEQCHNPIVADKKITTKISGKDLCFSCHKKDTTKLKEGDVHINDAKGGCTLCHSYHASKKKNLTVKESLSCFTCHQNTEKRTILMEKALKSIRCVPVKARKCFECHLPPHSLNPLYFKADKIQTCSRCHTQQHKITHPLGEDVKDPRNGQPITCITCHGMHSSKAEFMLLFDRKRALCIQCHKK